MSESQLIEYKESWHSWLSPKFRRSGNKYPIMLGEFCVQNSVSKTRSGLRRFAGLQMLGAVCCILVLMTKVTLSV